MSTFVVNSGGSSRSSSGNSSSTTSMIMGAPARELTGSRLFQYYMESFFKIPKDIKNDIIYCQRALKAHIKVHQMVLDVFQQQPDADPQQKKRILDELETEIFEINAEQHLLLLRLRRIIDEFYKMLKKNGIPTDVNATNAIVSKEIVPHISDCRMEILPINVLYRYTEDKLIEKYFEVQKDSEPSQPQQPAQPQCLEIIDLDDDGNVVEQINKVHGRQRGHKRELPSTSNSGNGESLLRNLNMGFNKASLLKPMSQRPTNEIVPADVKPKISKNTALADLYNQHMEDKEDKTVELPVSSNVRMSRMNLRQALKRAQAAVRGPATVPTLAPPPPPPPPQPIAVPQNNQKSSLAKARATRAAAAAATASGSGKSPEISSSSEEGTPERGPTPPHAYWPDELEETRTKADEYGQEMFLKIFDLFTPEVHAQMQQRRSKRRRRCVQNNHYHYGSQASGTTSVSEPEPKKKRKTAFLLSPQVKKALPNKRNKRRSADNASESNSVPPSRSASSSPDDKRSCNECFKGGYAMEQCEQCKFHYHPQCHREEDDPSAACQDPKEILKEQKICPGCKRNNDKMVKKEFIINKNLQNTAQELELKMAKEKSRREALQRTGKQYKIQMNNLFKIVNSIKSEGIDNSTIDASSTNVASPFPTATNDNIILLD